MFVKHLFRVAVVCFCLVTFGAIGSAQNVGGGDFGGGDFGGGNAGDFGGQGNGDQGTTGGGGGTGGTEADGELDTAEPVTIDLDIEDERNQGFVGPTAQFTDENGFAGTPTPNNALGGVAEDRFEGGGVNAGRGNRSATTTGRQLQDNGFTVIRKSIRSRLRVAFAAPATPGFVAQSRFQSRIMRQPVVRNFGAGVNVSVSNRTAVLTGTVSNIAEREIIKRQLRLEPGVYKIDDRTRVAN